STRTNLLKPKLPTVNGSARYHMHLTGLRLADGEYSVRVALMLEDGTEVHRVPEAGQFTALGDGLSHGVMRVDANFAWFDD
ncbi:MAG: hypothetical protein FWD83_08145, partial [Promicromonosporaceae bacterium]|nr:hypothetical protein [Promicromonosporaceae bacterium]